MYLTASRCGTFIPDCEGFDMREIGEESGPLYQRIDAGLPDLPVLPSQKCSAPVFSASGFFWYCGGAWGTLVMPN